MGVRVNGREFPVDADGFLNRRQRVSPHSELSQPDAQIVQRTRQLRAMGVRVNGR